MRKHSVSESASESLSGRSLSSKRRLSDTGSVSSHGNADAASESVNNLVPLAGMHLASPSSNATLSAALSVGSRPPKLPRKFPGATSVSSFRNITDDKLESYLEEELNRNTSRTTEVAIRNMDAFVVEQKIASSFDEFVASCKNSDKGALTRALCLWIVSVQTFKIKSRTTADPASGTLKTYFDSIVRYMKSTLDYDVRVEDPVMFEQLEIVMENRIRELSKNPENTRKSAAVPSADVIQQMYWAQDRKTPKGYRNSLMLLFCILTASRGGGEKEGELYETQRGYFTEEHLQGTQAIVFTLPHAATKNGLRGMQAAREEPKRIAIPDNGKKTIDENPFLLFQEYLKIHPFPDPGAPMWLNTNDGATVKEFFFKRMRMGCNKVKSFVKDMWESTFDTPCPQGLSNHSLRAYTASQLLGNGVSQVETMLRTGHRSTDGLKGYVSPMKNVNTALRHQSFLDPSGGTRKMLDDNCKNSPNLSSAAAGSKDGSFQEKIPHQGAASHPAGIQIQGTVQNLVVYNYHYAGGQDSPANASWGHQVRVSSVPAEVEKREDSASKSEAGIGSG